MSKIHRELRTAVECAMVRARRDGVTRVITTDADGRYHVHSVRLIPQSRPCVVASCTAPRRAEWAISR